MSQMKTYEWRGGLWRFTPKGAPADAVEHKPAPKPAPKARKTRNKARTARNKEADSE